MSNYLVWNEEDQQGIVRRRVAHAFEFQKDANTFLLWKKPDEDTLHEAILRTLYECFNGDRDKKTIAVDGKTYNVLPDFLVGNTAWIVLKPFKPGVETKQEWWLRRLHEKGIPTVHN